MDEASVCVLNSKHPALKFPENFPIFFSFLFKIAKVDKTEKCQRIGWGANLFDMKYCKSCKMNKKNDQNLVN